MARALLLALAPCCVLSRSVFSCGKPGDRLQNEHFSVSPDPIEHGKPFTFELTGDLDEDLNEMFADVSLNIKFLKFFQQKVDFTLKVSGHPHLSKGPTKIVVGPFDLDDGWFPASIYASGTVKLRDVDGHPIGCGELDDVNFGSFKPEGEGVARSQEMEEVGDDIPDDWNCGTPDDHMQNVTLSGTNTSLTVTGTVDEPLNYVKLTSSNSIKLGWVTLKTIKVTTPISYSPGFPAGPFELKIELVNSTLGASERLQGMQLKVLGYIKLDDVKDEEMLCVGYGKNPNKPDASKLITL